MTKTGLSGPFLFIKQAKIRFYTVFWLQNEQLISFFKFMLVTPE